MPKDPNILPTQQTSLRVEGFPLGPFQTNCYLVWIHNQPDQAWIIDAGFDPDPLIQRAQELQLKPKSLLLTHAHADHIGGISQVRAAFGKLPIHLHHAETAWLSDPELNLSAGYGIPITAPGPDAELSDNQQLTLGDTTWHVLHTPGHSPGSVTFHCPNANLAIVGDTLFHESIGRHDFPTSNHSDLTHSIQQRLYTMPDSTKVLPGHGPETNIAHEKRYNPFIRAD